MQLSDMYTSTLHLSIIQNSSWVSYGWYLFVQHET